MGLFLGERRRIPRFIRSFNDWELDEILSLLNTIQGKQIIKNQEDLMFSRRQKMEIFR